ncbi:MAG TPA: trypsin-like peptidase domain-containing protein [bacterium]
MRSIHFVLCFLFFIGCSEEKPPETQSQAAVGLNAQPAANQERNGTDSVSSSRRNAITNAVALVSDAVCGINVTQIREFVRTPFTFYDDPFFRYLLPAEPYYQRVKSLGSGFLVSSDGYILTNEHVIHQATEILVTLSDGTQQSATLVGMDLITDIALLKIKGNSYPFVRFGDSDNALIGEWVIAIGNPFGLFEINAKPTVTVGVVSAVDRDFGRVDNDRVYQDMIQTDAAINQGNSGGPLVNGLGEVIGMNTFIYTSKDNTGSIGLGFAIPINRIKRVLRDLKEFGEVNRRWTSGLKVEDLTPLVARYFKLKTERGVIVTEVDKDSPAARAGLEIGDIITEVNEQKIENRNDIWTVIEDSDLRGGDDLNLTVLRERKVFKLTLRLEGLGR